MQEQTTSPSLESIVKSIENLSVDEKKELLEFMLETYWEERGLSITPPFFTPILKKASIFTKILKNVANDPQWELEQAYMDIQSNLIQTRQGVAQAIATQKLLNEQIYKIETFKQNILDSLANETDEKIIREKNEKIASFERSLVTTIKQEEEQSKRVSDLRILLKDGEVLAQKAYTMKQSLIARSKAVHTHAKAKKLFEEFFSTNMDTELSKFEKQVKAAELEQNLGTAEDSDEDKDFIIRTHKAIQHQTWVLERVEEMLLKFEKKDDK